MRLALIGLPKSYNSYQDSVNGRDKLPYWEHSWSNFVIEEIRWSTRDETSGKDKEEHFSFVGKYKKAKGNRSQGEEGKRDLSKIKFSHCHEHEPYASNCQ